MNYLKTQLTKTIKPAATKAVGRYGRGLLEGHRPRAPDALLEITAAKPKVCPIIRDKGCDIN
jgi:hypothetical protein